MLRVGVVIILQVPAFGVRKLASDLIGDLIVHMHLNNLQQGLLLLSGYVRFVTLHKR